LVKAASFLSSDPLGRVPAIGLVSNLSSLTFKSRSGEELIMVKSENFKNPEKGAGLILLNLR